MRNISFLPPACLLSELELETCIPNGGWYLLPLAGIDNNKLLYGKNMARNKNSLKLNLAIVKNISGYNFKGKQEIQVYGISKVLFKHLPQL